MKSLFVSIFCITCFCLTPVIQAESSIENNIIFKAAEYNLTNDIIAFLPYIDDISSHNNLGQTLLHIAVLNDNIDLINALIDHKININALDFSDASALDYATAKGSIDIINILVKSGAKISIDKTIAAVKLD